MIGFPVEAGTAEKTQMNGPLPIMILIRTLGEGREDKYRDVPTFRRTGE
jgi:hypothetical protein